MSRHQFPLPASMVILAALLAAGCTSGRITTTTRTAVEQALLSQTTEESIGKMKFDGLSGKVFIRKDYCTVPDSEYIIGTLQKHFLDMGLAVADDCTTVSADTVVYPVVAHGGIDDTTVMIGVPSIPMTLGNLGNVTLPEIALFKYSSQTARNRMYVMAKNMKTKKLTCETETVATEKYYDRYVLFFVFSFRLSDLKAPYSTPKLSQGGLDK